MTLQLMWFEPLSLPVMGRSRRSHASRLPAFTMDPIAGLSFSDVCPSIDPGPFAAEAVGCFDAPGMFSLFPLWGLISPGPIVVEACCDDC